MPDGGVGSVGHAGSVGIDARAICFGYGARPLFDGLSLSIRPGEMVGLIGANGSGKTTLLKILSGLLTPSAGELRAGERDRPNIGRERKREIASVNHVESVEFQIFNRDVHRASQ